MNLSEITDNLRVLMSEFQAKELPNYPNVLAVFQQSEIVYEITDGETATDNLIESTINLTLKIAVSSRTRTNDDNNSPRDLNTLISVLVNTLRKKNLPNCKNIRFNSFTKFTPESGLWRAILNFTIVAYLDDDDVLFDFIEGSPDGKIQEINIRYQSGV